MAENDNESRMWRKCRYCSHQIHCNKRGMDEHENLCDEKPKQSLTSAPRIFKIRNCPAPKCGRVVTREAEILTCVCGWKLEIIDGGKIDQPKLAS